MHLHDFLTEVHAVVKPSVYLEVGVQHGTSLNRAYGAELAIGVDPEPLCLPASNQQIARMPSDEFFAQFDPGFDVDLGFIDGLHHYEQALRDFCNLAQFTPWDGVIVIDDVLPRNQEEANRVQCPGDWTGDVWKVTHILLTLMPRLEIREVDTQPTGTLLVWNLGAYTNSEYAALPDHPEVAKYMDLTEVPGGTLNRDFATSPEEALIEIKEYINGPG